MKASKAYEVIRPLRLMSAVTDLDRLLQIILQAVKKTMSAEASSLMLLDHAANELYFHQIRGGKKGVKEIRLKVGQGIAGRVAQTGRPLIVNDVDRSPFFFRGADKKTGFRTRQILAVPMHIRRTVIGVLEAINKRSGRRFDREDLEIFNAFANQAAAAIENARLYSLAAYDGLTRAFTRRYFEGWFESEFARLRRYGRPLCLMIIDVDHFKRVNTRYGHPGGDRVLAALSAAVRAAVRTSDVLARYGGEEFIVALTETPADRGALVADRIRQAVERSEFDPGQGRIPITVSIGVTSFREEPGLTAARMVQEADQALYRAKKRRNSVAVFRPGP